MRIIVIGATGTIGQEVVKLLAPAHDIVKVGNRRGDYQVDLGSRQSIEKLFAEVGTVDALVSAAGGRSSVVWTSSPTRTTCSD